MPLPINGPVSGGVAGVVPAFAPKMVNGIPHPHAGTPLLEVRNLRTHFDTERGLFRAVDGISFTVTKGRTVGLVGESGCGKSVTSLSLMGLVPEPPGKVMADALVFEGRDILKLPAAERRSLRGSAMSMIFQEPMTCLNPVHTVGQQLVEGILAHKQISHQAARERAIAMLDLVRIPSPKARMDDFPHRLSGCDTTARVPDPPACGRGPRLLDTTLGVVRGCRPNNG